MTQTDIFELVPPTGDDLFGKVRKIRRARKSDPESSKIAAEVEERFQKHVEPEPTSGCHLWTGALNNTGYGQFRIGRRADANAMTVVLAHRVAWNLYRGRIPFGMHVLHRCDTPACVNPDHLFLGTHMDNHHDKAMKGRGTRSKRGLPFGVQPVSGYADKWQVCVTLGGEKHYLGCFASIEEASKTALNFKPVANPLPRPC